MALITEIDNVIQKNLDLYAILEINENADSKEIRSAYKKQALKTHPDKNTSESNEAFVNVKLAYDILIDPDSKEYYNQQRRNSENVSQAASEDYSDEVLFQRKNKSFQFEPEVDLFQNTRQLRDACKKMLHDLKFEDRFLNIGPVDYLRQRYDVDVNAFLKDPKPEVFILQKLHDKLRSLLNVQLEREEAARKQELRAQREIDQLKQMERDRRPPNDDDLKLKLLQESCKQLRDELGLANYGTIIMPDNTSFDLSVLNEKLFDEYITPEQNDFLSELSKSLDNVFVYLQKEKEDRNALRTRASEEQTLVQELARKCDILNRTIKGYGVQNFEPPDNPFYFKPFHELKTLKSGELKELHDLLEMKVNALQLLKEIQTSQSYANYHVVDKQMERFVGEQTRLIMNADKVSLKALDENLRAIKNDPLRDEIGKQIDALFQKSKEFSLTASSAKTKANDIISAMCNLPVEQRRFIVDENAPQTQEILAANSALARRRGMLYASTTIDKEGFVDNDKATNSFKSLKERYKAIVVEGKKSDEPDISPPLKNSSP